MDTFSLISRLLGSAVLGSGRPVAALFGVQVVAALAIHQQGATLPAEVAWTVSPFALVVGLVAVALELLVQHTEGADELIRAMHAEKILAGVAGIPALALLLLLTSVSTDARDRAVSALVADGLRPGQAALIVDEASRSVVEGVEKRRGAKALKADARSNETAKAIRVLEQSQLNTGEKSVLFLVAFALQWAMTWVRGEVREYVDDLELSSVWAWVETGGIGVGVALLVLAPPLILAFSIVAALLSFGLWLFIRVTAHAVDRARRRPCPSCEASIRTEALRCFACGTDVTPTRLLGAKGAESAPALSEST